MKRTIAIGLTAIVATAVLTGCSSSKSSKATSASSAGAASTSTGSSTTAATSSKGGKIGVVLSNSSNPYFEVMSEGIKTQANANGFTVIERDAPDGLNNTTFNTNVDSLVSLGVKALIVAPIGATNLQAIKRAAAKGIPVVELDSPIAGWTGATATIATDNVSAGRLSMSILIAKLKAAGKPLDIGILNNTLGYQSVNDRTKGAQEQAATDGAKVKIINGGTSQAIAQSNVETALRADSKLDGILATVGGVYGLGANAAMRTAHVKVGQVYITGVDGVAAEVALIKAGPYYIGTAAQQPRLMGVNGVIAIANKLAGKPVTQSQSIPAAKVTTANAATFHQ